jgi:hypothetical protein
LEVVVVAVAGLLAMHGFEAALIAADHGAPDGHASASASSPAESHVAGGTCSVEKPGAPITKFVDSCPLGYSPADAFVRNVGAEIGVVGFVRRGALAAFSILRV